MLFDGLWSICTSSLVLCKQYFFFLTYSGINIISDVPIFMDFVGIVESQSKRFDEKQIS